MNQVRLIEFQGHNGGFATAVSTLYRVELFNGSQTHSFYSPMASNNYAKKIDAESAARYWSTFLGWTVVNFIERKAWQSTLTLATKS
jgi:hypothetical protein